MLINRGKGRHVNQPREERICKLCEVNEMETEDHLLVRFYNILRTKGNLTGQTDSNMLL